MPDAAAAPFLEVEDVAHAPGASEGTAPVGPVTFSVPRGGILSMVGPAGCGSDTIIRLVAGLQPVRQGRVKIGGEPAGRKPASVGVVFREPLLLEWRSVLSNVLLQAEIRGLDGRRAQARARLLLATAGLAAWEDTKPGRLSLAAAKKVSICRALVHSPQLLALDEPFHGLDAIAREQLTADLQRLLSDSNTTVLLATSQIIEAVVLSDQIAVMSSAPGRVLQIRSVDLPRPRRWDQETTHRFAAHAGEIRTLFHAHGVLF